MIADDYNIYFASFRFIFKCASWCTCLIFLWSYNKINQVPANKSLLFTIIDNGRFIELLWEFPVVINKSIQHSFSFIPQKSVLNRNVLNRFEELWFFSLISHHWPVEVDGTLLRGVYDLFILHSKEPISDRFSMLKRSARKETTWCWDNIIVNVLWAFSFSLSDNTNAHVLWACCFLLSERVFIDRMVMNENANGTLAHLYCFYQRYVLLHIVTRRMAWGIRIYE